MIKQRLKSKTNLMGMAIAALGVVQANFPQIQASLGDKAGFAYIGIGIVTMVIMRELTTQPVGEK